MRADILSRETGRRALLRSSASLHHSAGGWVPPVRHGGSGSTRVDLSSSRSNGRGRADLAAGGPTQQRPRPRNEEWLAAQLRLRCTPRDLRFSSGGCSALDLKAGVISRADQRLRLTP
ncbi:hypothetical protein MRX96_007071 [Rhipicephalus microplus]